VSLIRPPRPGEGAPLPLGSTVYHRVHEHLRAEILSGRIAPGTRLRIQKLATRYGLSHMPVRAALQQLQGEGLVILAPNRGATVRRMDAAFVRNIFAIREALAGYLTRHAAGFLDEEAIATLRRIQAETRRPQTGRDPAVFARLSRAFHRTVEAATGNDEAIRLLDLHSDLPGALGARFGCRPGRLQLVLRQHDALIEALARGGAGAGVALSTAIAETANAIRTAQQKVTS
jgi:DNA-binding GntR family transcriptional regulator